MRQLIFNFFLVIFYFFQVGIEFLISSDIPIVISNAQFWFFIGYSIFFVVIFIAFSPRVSSRSVLVISLLFFVVWLLLLINAYRLLSPPTYLLVINYVGVVTPIIIHTVSRLQKRRSDS